MELAGGPALMPARILVVDDEDAIRRALVRVLGDAGYQCEAAANAGEARQRLAESSFELMLCDVMMPDESGFSLLAAVHQLYPDLAVIMVTAVADPIAAEPVAKHGAYGYILKPYEASAVLINVAGALHRRSEVIAERLMADGMRRELDDRAANLAAAVRQLDSDALALRSSRQETVERLAMAAEWRDAHTGLHLQRMSAYTERLAVLSGQSAEQVELLALASKMHDIGKVALPDDILLKPGLLSPEERLVMQRHSEIGANMLHGSDSPLMRMGATLALTHHERWDGSGYPRGLRSLEIPVEARIVAIADVFDALRSIRPYKRAFSLAEALDVMRQGRASHFDPELLDLFVDDLSDGDDTEGSSPSVSVAQSEAT
ncbi:MAG TPA: HD domain-containing phosphohydrolase [Acidimicrobiales bacterium]|nr:HD domain-containing phosphohydrolase [Acidimicrobiales bacterium]